MTEVKSTIITLLCFLSIVVFFSSCMRTISTQMAATNHYNRCKYIRQLSGFEKHAKVCFVISYFALQTGFIIQKNTGGT